MTDQSEGSSQKQNKNQLRAAEIKEVLTKLEDGIFEIYPNEGGFSDVWKTFMLIKDSQTNQRIPYAQCTECKILLRFKDLSGTSHLGRHTCTFPNERENDVTNYRNLPLAKVEEVQGQLMQNIIKLCAEELYSYETVCDSTRFVEFLQSLVSLIHKYGRIDLKKIYPKTSLVRQTVVNSNEDKLHELYIKFREAKKNDQCSATIAFRKYTNSIDINLLIVSIQYFEKDLTGLKKKVIFSTSVADKDTPETIKLQLIKSFSLFGGDKYDFKSLTIVTPKNENLSKALNFVYSRKDCLAFTIKNILDESFAESTTDEITELLSKCRGIVRIVMSNEQHQMELSQDNGNWKSKFLMLCSIIGQYDKIAKILEDENNKQLKINMRRAEELKKFLEPFVDAIDDLSATTYTTANKILLWWVDINDHLNTHDDYSSEIKNIMMNAMTHFASSFHPTMDNKIDCFLDPRYKSLLMLNETEKLEVYEEVRNLLKTMEVENAAPDVPVKAPTDYNPEGKKARFAKYEGNKADTKKPKKTDAVKSNKKDRFARFETKNANIQETDEVNKYINLPSPKSSTFESEYDIITKYWKPRNKTLPKLFKLVSCRLHVPACCGSDWENNFSLKENLKPETINELLIAKDNF